ncbi:MAG: VWA domain-containing protein [Deltaproteobacteria bacterium]|nr:VWA domain-containing protein [Deltaproteobacteria bacterium]
MTKPSSTQSGLSAGVALCAAFSLFATGASSHAAQSVLQPTRPTHACDVSGAVASRDTATFIYGTLGGTLSTAKIQSGGDGQIFASFEVQTRNDAGNKERAPVDVALVVDRSGSMDGDKIEYARRAAEGLVARLGVQDRVTLIQYDDSAQVLVPLTRLDAAGRVRLRRMIQTLQPGGGTNLHAGLVLGRNQLARSEQRGRVNRIILLSDGHANEGITDPSALAEVARRSAQQGIRLSAMGIGQDYNEDLMESLAEHGRGRYHYVAKANDLETILGNELASLKATVARNTELRIEPACDGVEVIEVFGYESRREGRVVVVPMADLFAGDSRRILVSLRVPSSGVGPRSVLRTSLSFEDVTTQKATNISLALGAELSNDPLAVEAAADRDMVASILEVQAATAMKQAATAFERGDKAAARAVLESVESEVANKKRQYKLDDVQASGALMGVGSFKDEINSYDASSSEGKHAMKQSKASARMKMKVSAKNMQ